MASHWSWLQRVGVVSLTGLHPAGSFTQYPELIKLFELYVTDRGRALLQSGEASPHNPAGFYARIRGQIASPDNVVMTYLDEAVGAWGAGLNRAAAVMIGCACEQLILLLAGSISDGDVPPYSQRLKKDLEKTVKSPVSISTIFETVRDALLALKGEKKLSGDVAKALDRRLTPIFEFARALRNTGGHPTAAPVTTEEAEAALLLFPSFYFFVNDVMLALDAMGTPGAKTATA